MDLLRAADYSLQVKHRHSDGSWATLEAVEPHHGSDDHDPERGWLNGTIYRCPTCEEEVLVSREEDEAPRARR
jgi:hypothetical protein